MCFSEYVGTSQEERPRNKNKQGETQEWKEQNNKTFLLVQISCEYRQLLVTRTQQPSLVRCVLFATPPSKWIAAFMHP